jgi:hypothetical protein
MVVIDILDHDRGQLSIGVLTEVPLNDGESKSALDYGLPSGFVFLKKHTTNVAFLSHVQAPRRSRHPKYWQLWKDAQMSDEDVQRLKNDGYWG